MNTREVFYEKVFMSPRPPPKISLKHEWKRELGSKHAQRSQIGQLSRSFQSNQPILNPNRERTERPVVRDDTRTVQDGRKTSRSQEIGVNSFHEESVSSERTERPFIETSVIQARSSEDSKDPNVGKAHERTRRLVIETNTENVPDGSQTRSFHESETFNVGDKILRERTERPVVDHDTLSHEQTMLNEVNMDFRIPGLPHSVVKHAQSTSVRELIQKIENHPDRHALQQDLRQNQAYNPLSEPKTQCTACLSYWNVGIVFCTCGHSLQRETDVNRKFGKYTMHFLSLPEYVIKKGRPHGHRYGKKPGDKECYLANQLKKKCQKREFQGIHDRFLHDHELIEHNRDEEVCRRWDLLADEDHTHHLTEKEYVHYKNKWWLHSNKSGSDTLPLRNRSDFKQALSTLESLHQEAGEEPYVPTYSYKHKHWQLAQSSSSTWWNWQDSW